MALTHYLGALRIATCAMHCLTALGPWAVEVVQRTTSLPGASGLCKSCNAMPRRRGAAGNGTPAMRGPISRGIGSLAQEVVAAQRVELLQVLPHYLGQWAVQILLYTASLPGGRGQWRICIALPHCLGQWALKLLQRTTSLLAGSGQWNSCNTLPHRMGAQPHRLRALGSGTMQCATVQLGGQRGLPRRGSMPKEQTSCNAMPYCLGVMGSAVLAIHCLAAWGSGHWKSCDALPHWGGGGAAGSATPATHALTA